MRRFLTLVIQASTGVSLYWGAQSACAQNNVGDAERESFAIAPGEGRPFSAGRAVVESGQGDFSVFVTTLPPADSPATPLHRHDVYDEGFLVLDGVVDFVAGDKTMRCAAGCFAFILRGVDHGFSNRGPGDARMWVVGSSGVQAMVEEVAPC